MAIDSSDSTESVDVVREYWTRMASNDFASVGAVLADDYVLDWPQSRERIRGRQNFARVNSEYPAHGPWLFKIRALFGSGRDVVSDVEVSDGVQHARALTFFTVVDGKISRQVEYWPDPFAAAANRAHLVERIEI